MDNKIIEKAKEDALIGFYPGVYKLYIDPKNENIKDKLKEILFEAIREAMKIYTKRRSIGGLILLLYDPRIYSSGFDIEQIKDSLEQNIEEKIDEIINNLKEGTHLEETEIEVNQILYSLNKNKVGSMVANYTKERIAHLIDSLVKEGEWRKILSIAEHLPKELKGYAKEKISEAVGNRIAQFRVDLTIAMNSDKEGFKKVVKDGSKEFESILRNNSLSMNLRTYAGREMVDLYMFYLNKYEDEPSMEKLSGIVNDTSLPKEIRDYARLKREEFVLDLLAKYEESKDYISLLNLSVIDDIREITKIEAGKALVNVVKSIFAENDINKKHKVLRDIYKALNNGIEYNGTKKKLPAKIVSEILEPFLSSVVHLFSDRQVKRIINELAIVLKEYRSIDFEYYLNYSNLLLEKKNAEQLLTNKSPKDLLDIVCNKNKKHYIKELALQCLIKKLRNEYKPEDRLNILNLLVGLDPPGIEIIKDEIKDACKALATSNGAEIAFKKAISMKPPFRSIAIQTTLDLILKEIKREKDTLQILELFDLLKYGDNPEPEEIKAMELAQNTLFTMTGLYYSLFQRVNKGVKVGSSLDHDIEELIRLDALINLNEAANNYLEQIDNWKGVIQFLNLLNSLNFGSLGEHNIYLFNLLKQTNEDVKTNTKKHLEVILYNTIRNAFLDYLNLKSAPASESQLREIHKTLIEIIESNEMDNEGKPYVSEEVKEIASAVSLLIEKNLRKEVIEKINEFKQTFSKIVSSHEYSLEFKKLAIGVASQLPEMFEAFVNLIAEAIDPKAPDGRMHYHPTIMAMSIIITTNMLLSYKELTPKYRIVKELLELWENKLKAAEGKEFYPWPDEIKEAVKEANKIINSIKPGRIRIVFREETGQKLFVEDPTKAAKQIEKKIKEDTKTKKTNLSLNR